MALPGCHRRAAVVTVGLATLLTVSLVGPAAAQTEPTTTTTLTEVAAGPPTKTVQVLDNSFKPRKVKVVVGTKVTWKWGGVAAHNVVVTNGPQKFKSKTFAKGKYSRTITKPGKYLIVCTIHPGMNMQLRARTAPPPTTTTTTTTIADVAPTEPGA